LCADGDVDGVERLGNPIFNGKGQRFHPVAARGDGEIDRQKQHILAGHEQRAASGAMIQEPAPAGHRHHRLFKGSGGCIMRLTCRHHIVRGLGQFQSSFAADLQTALFSIARPG
jgi:hypothetical protein